MNNPISPVIKRNLKNKTLPLEIRMNVHNNYKPLISPLCPPNSIKISHTILDNYWVSLMHQPKTNQQNRRSCIATLRNHMIFYLHHNLFMTLWKDCFRQITGGETGEHLVNFWQRCRSLQSPWTKIRGCQLRSPGCIFQLSSICL